MVQGRWNLRRWSRISLGLLQQLCHPAHVIGCAPRLCRKTSSARKTLLTRPAACPTLCRRSGAPDISGGYLSCDRQIQFVPLRSVSTAFANGLNARTALRNQTRGRSCCPDLTHSPNDRGTGDL